MTGIYTITNKKSGRVYRIPHTEIERILRERENQRDQPEEKQISERLQRHGVERHNKIAMFLFVLDIV